MKKKQKPIVWFHSHTPGEESSAFSIVVPSLIVSPLRARLLLYLLIAYMLKIPIIAHPAHNWFYSESSLHLSKFE